MVYEPYIYTADMRLLEEECGIPESVLMENAGVAATKCLLKEKFVEDLIESKTFSVLVLCGTGNNGGDGYVMARCIAEQYPNCPINIVALGGKPKTETAYAMYQKANKLAENRERLKIHYVLIGSNTDQLIKDIDEKDKPTVVIDAVYGIGFHSKLLEPIAELFGTVKKLYAYNVAVDIPSGVSADSGEADPDAIKANLTITFASKKRCMLLESSQKLCGNVRVCDIGIDESLVAEYQFNPRIITDETAATIVPHRFRNSHKGTYGSVFSLAGSYGMAGAALLSGEAALRCGIGLLHVFVPAAIYPIVASQLWEAVCHPLDSEPIDGRIINSLDVSISQKAKQGKAAFMCGPGLSDHPSVSSCLRQLLPKIHIPMVIDADGLNAFVGHIDEWKAIADQGATLVLTPHPLEAARLLECEVEDIERDRIGSAFLLAQKTKSTVVLKGHETIIVDSKKRLSVNVTACSGLAKGGSGDVLTGMIAALLAQGVSPYSACVCAVYLHGLASLRVARRLGETGMLPTDLIKELPALLSDFEVRE